jgi:tetratricopeptide (TPR) repeat protein
MSGVCRLAALFPALVTWSLLLQSTPQSSTPTAAQAPGFVGSAAASIPPTALAPNPLHDALLLYRKGDFDGAISLYQQILTENKNVPDAYAGLIRSYLKKKDVEQAYDTANKALQVVDAVNIRVALGEVYFRQGRIHEAEQEWVKVINSGHPDARAYMGIARIRWAMSNYQSGWSFIDKAHTIDPADPEITEFWSAKLSRAERIKYLQDALAGDNTADEQTRTAMRQYLEYLLARAKGQDACPLVSKQSNTETPLVRLLANANHLRGYGLAVEVNGHKTHVMLDTGASGLLINKSLAEKAGLSRLSSVEIGGIGDKGKKSGYRALASSIKIGELEFQNCPVEVLDKRSVVDEQGLIGADVFSSFLVDIDFPNEKLRLSELPKRPEDKQSSVNLHTEDDESEGDNQPTDASSPAAKDSKPTTPGLQDRYVAPEMKSYTPAFRFGHFLLVPTMVDKVPGKLFLLDSGAFSSQITPAAAREVTKVHGDDYTIVTGLSGSVKNVFRADDAVLQFGHVRQKNQDLVAFDLTHLSDDVGTEISGTLGFTVLRFIDLKIDYRDGLVDFSYDPKRWGQ